jgi:hypothetical protein
MISATRTCSTRKRGLSSKTYSTHCEKGVAAAGAEERVEGRQRDGPRWEECRDGARVIDAKMRQRYISERPCARARVCTHVCVRA